MEKPSYLQSIKKELQHYKSLGDKTFAQLPDDALFWQYNEMSNSIAIIVQHLHGNMLSRWTDFLNSDGEKQWRNRDAEFEMQNATRTTLLENWEKGWKLVLETLASLHESDLQRIVYIRHQGHTVMEAINRQLAHYAMHVGQIIYIGKMILNDNWQSLSIPKGASANYNAEKFSKRLHRAHFTDEKE